MCPAITDATPPENCCTEALMAAGVSRVRVLVPIIMAVAVVSLFSAANRELVIPR